MTGDRQLIKELIGERLTELRLDLAKRTGEKWPMCKVAKAVGITQSMIERIEGGLGGTIDVYAAIFDFYHGKGYNVNWIVIKDNVALSKYRVPVESNTIQIEELLVKVENFKRHMDHAVDTMVMDMLVNS